MIDRFEEYDLNELPEAPIPELAELSREAAAEGIVLLKNEGVLPLCEGARVALFGRSQFDTVTSGLGSGGLVNTPYTTNYCNSLREAGIEVYEPLAAAYEDWIDRNPFDNGSGWATQPINQIELVPDDEMVRAAAEWADTAILFISRKTGECIDNRAAEGGYLLTKDERTILESIAANFSKVAVVLGVSGLIDTTFAEDERIGALLYAWQGGQEGGRATAEVLCGKVCPSGRLAATALYNLADHPATDNFGGDKQNIYAEDIYVGYRYFETVGKDKVQYPFGYGLSYTDFDMKTDAIGVVGDRVSLSVKVTNTGDHAGKEVVQVYYSAPQGTLGRPARELAAFGKTALLQPSEEAHLGLEFQLSDMAAYDDSGATGHQYCYLLEAGAYTIYVGANVRDARPIFTYIIDDTRVISRHVSALAPVTPFERMKPLADGQAVTMTTEPTPLRQYDLAERIASGMPTAIPITGDRDIKLFDVAGGEATLEQFIAQLTDEQLMCLLRGEGMSSPKVTPGTGAAYGGVTDELLGYGVPIACATDGPSGIRLDSGAKATLMPIGTQLACSWNCKLVERLYSYEGVELRAYKIDTLLGPGLNIQRHPLCGRNFEYFSEDPLLTGLMAAAATRGLAACGVSGTIKHFACNNQEYGRNFYDSIVSERALREIYLRPFRIAVEQGGSCAVMTAYNRLNGIYTAGSYDLTTTLLRDEWGFGGFVMSDWWADINDEGGKPGKTNLAACVRSQNDIYMVVSNASTHADNMAEQLLNGKITRAQLQRNAMNICRHLMTTPAFERFKQSGGKIESADNLDPEQLPLVAAFDDIGSLCEMPVFCHEGGKYLLVITLKCDAPECAQVNLAVNTDGHGNATATTGDTAGQEVLHKRILVFDKGRHSITFEYEENMLTVTHAELRKMD